MKKLVLLFFITLCAVAAHSQTPVECEVIVAGGSLSALSAALTSAREGSKTCLIEPTDWPGGQLTNEGVSAIDEAWHTYGNQNFATQARASVNQNVEFYSWLNKIGNPGGCWVSRFCFSPQRILSDFIQPTIAKEANLTVYYNSVIKNIETRDETSKIQKKVITSVQAVTRTRKDSSTGVLRLSDTIHDWYSVSESENFTKELKTFTGPQGRDPIVIEGTAFGDVLVLSGAPFLQGVEESEKSPVGTLNRCGQATVFPFVAKAVQAPAEEPQPVPFLADAKFNFKDSGYKWDKIWSYRRILTNSDPKLVGQLSLQNWGTGNDYTEGYLFLGKDGIDSQRADWYGGISTEVLRGAEAKAYNFYDWLKKSNPQANDMGLVLDRKELGSDTGLSKMPYIRDTRRSVGAGNYVLDSVFMRGHYAGQPEGVMFGDRVAIGLYTFDMHAVQTGCKFPHYIYEIDTKSAVPYSIPLRSLTNAVVANLIPTGKSIAQTFVTNSSTRVHPIEWSTGVAAGVAASFMYQHKIYGTAQLGLKYRDLQPKILKYQPLNWQR